VPLNPKQLAFLKLYLGRDQRYHGNATRSYMKAYDMEDEKMAQVGGSRLCRTNAEIRQAVDDFRTKAAEEIGADAAFVLEQSIHLYDIAMGHKPVEVDVIDRVTRKDSDGNKELVHVPRTIEKRVIDLSIASKQLDQIGRHTSVQAFQDNVEHTHTHKLEQALAKRHKQIEANARPRDITSQVEVINDQGGVPAGEEAKKRVHQGGGQDRGQPAPEKTPLSAAGAPGK